MASYDVAFVGAGADPDVQDDTGFSMAYRHASAYDRLADHDCRLAGVADVVVENAAAFADQFGIDDDAVFESHDELLATVEPDVVSVCTPPDTHADIVVDCAESGVVDAIHCEKPMARTWADCERIERVADETGVRVTFNHQRRFGEPYRRAKALLDEGAIGDLERVEMAARNVYDYGSHSVDLCNYFNDEGAAEWVVGQVDYRAENLVFGVHNENQALAEWRYENGVHGLAATGEGVADLVDCHNRLVGSEGTIEVGRGFPNGTVDDRVLRVKRDGDDDWEYVDVGGEGLHGSDSAAYGRTYIDRAVADVVDALARGETSELAASNALRATEIIFGIWESSRARGRVDLPLAIEDNPLDEMVDSGALDPGAGDD
jgi:predicted dehydrogenase